MSRSERDSHPESESRSAGAGRPTGEIQYLNPARKKRVELPADVRELIVKKERTIRDIVNAELHYWAATIENNPLTRFDATEQA
jgi:hypothetical protein